MNDKQKKSLEEIHQKKLQIFKKDIKYFAGKLAEIKKKSDQSVDFEFNKKEKDKELLILDKKIEEKKGVIKKTEDEKIEIEKVIQEILSQKADLDKEIHDKKLEINILSETEDETNSKIVSLYNKINLKEEIIKSKNLIIEGLEKKEEEQIKIIEAFEKQYIKQLERNADLISAKEEITTVIETLKKEANTIKESIIDIESEYKKTERENNQVFKLLKEEKAVIQVRIKEKLEEEKELILKISETSLAHNTQKSELNKRSKWLKQDIQKLKVWLSKTERYTDSKLPPLPIISKY